MPFISLFNCVARLMCSKFAVEIHIFLGKRSGSALKLNIFVIRKEKRESIAYNL